MTWLIVALGGALGAMARYGIFVWLSPHPGKFPIATYLANIGGCFLAGALYVLMAQSVIPNGWRPFIAIGFLGAFTTFSTFSLEALLLWQNQLAPLAAFYAAATLVSCLISVWLGHTAASAVFSQ